MITITRAWVVSDTHFGHANIYSVPFRDDNGDPIRPFDDVDQADSTMVANWNAVVGEDDKVFHLGDAVWRSSSLGILEELNGQKELILGNHDIFEVEEYLKYFDNVRAYKQYNKHGIIMSHIPIHPNSLGRWGLNVHGHTHTSLVKDANGDPDPRYLNVAVEQTHYSPINLETIFEVANNLRGEGE